jgi:hypothetical protein
MREGISFSEDVHWSMYGKAYWYFKKRVIQNTLQVPVLNKNRTVIMSGFTIEKEDGLIHKIDTLALILKMWT